MDPKNAAREHILFGQSLPTNAPSVLEIPAVPVIERLEVLIIASNDAHGANPIDPRAEHDDVTDLHLAGKATYEASLEARVLFSRASRAQNLRAR